MARWTAKYRLRRGGCECQGRRGDRESRAELAKGMIPRLQARGLGPGKHQWLQEGGVARWSGSWRGNA